jgi:hypothetical protein
MSLDEAVNKAREDVEERGRKQREKDRKDILGLLRRGVPADVFRAIAANVTTDKQGVWFTYHGGRYVLSFMQSYHSQDLVKIYKYVEGKHLDFADLHYVNDGRGLLELLAKIGEDDD